MPNQALIDRWIELFPGLENLDAEHLATARGAIRFAQLASGGVAYHQGWECPNYVMCIEGTTRVFKSSGLGREILIYKVGPGETCVLTTSCLMVGGTFPAESVAETPARLACLLACLPACLPACQDISSRIPQVDAGFLLRYWRNSVTIQSFGAMIWGQSCHILRVKAKAVVLSWILTVA